jgi:hypothetical protein
MVFTSIVALCIAIFIVLVVQFCVIAALAAYLLMRQSSSHVDHETEKREVLKNQVGSRPPSRTTKDRAGTQRPLPVTHEQQRPGQIDDSSSMYSNPEPLILEPTRGRGNAGR